MRRDVAGQRHAERIDQREDHLAAGGGRFVDPVDRAVAGVAGVVIDVEHRRSIEARHAGARELAALHDERRVVRLGHRGRDLDAVDAGEGLQEHGRRRRRRRPWRPCPCARSARAIAIAEPIASPSGRWCEATTNRRPAFTAATNSVGGLLRLVMLGRVGRRSRARLRLVDSGSSTAARRFFGVDLLDDLLDAVLRGDRFVEDEFQLGRRGAA